MSVTYNFENKHILVTGATSGIGLQNATDLSNADATLTLIGRNEKKIEQLKKGLNEFFIGDLTKSEFIEQIGSGVQPIDGLVFSAGTVDYTPAKMINKEKINRVFDINFNANVLLIQTLLKKRKINNNASIIIISSISCKLGVPGTALYAASKAAISAYAKVLASELSSKKIRVNTISPGIVKTNLIVDKGVLSETLFNEAEQQYPLGYGSTSDVSNQIMYLLSDVSKWVTGSEFIIDGGYTIN